MVRILVASRRPCEAEALATSSYDTNFDQPLSADTLVRAAVKVVLPWSTWPIVPTLTCGFFRSNFSLAMGRAPRWVLLVKCCRASLCGGGGLLRQSPEICNQRLARVSAMCPGTGA